MNRNMIDVVFVPVGFKGSSRQRQAGSPRPKTYIIAGGSIESPFFMRLWIWLWAGWVDKKAGKFFGYAAKISATAASINLSQSV